MTNRRELSDAASDLLLGNVCVGCTRPGHSLCLRCAAVLEQFPFVAWPTPRPLGLPCPYAVSDYAGPAKAAVIAHKESRVLSLAKPLGRALSLAVMAVLASLGRTGPPAVVWLVPPPASATSVRARGHDPLARVLRACVGALRASGVAARPAQLLERARQVADQAGLSAQARSANLSGAFRVRSRSTRGAAGRPVVIVDDVLTTGATAAEVARCLTAAGADVLGVAVVAATRRRQDETSRAEQSTI